MEITRFVQLSFSEEYLEQFIQGFETKRKQILSYEGCLEVVLYTDIQKKGLCFTVSTWSSEQALSKYRQSEWFQSTWSQIKEHFTDKPAAWTTQKNH